MHGVVAARVEGGGIASIIQRLVAQGAEAIILGCTELMMIIEAEDSAVPLFDTTTLHCEAALDFAMGTREAPL